MEMMGENTISTGVVIVSYQDRRTTRFQFPIWTQEKSKKTFLFLHYHIFDDH